MPIFDYVCSVCGHRFEELVSHATDAVACTKCGAAAQKQLSAFASPAGSSRAASDACASCPTAGG